MVVSVRMRLLIVVLCASLVLRVAFGWPAVKSAESQDSISVPANCSIPAEEYLALYDLYESTNGAGWAWRNSEYEWDFSGDSDPCVDSWEGLTCSETVSPFHITNINLTSYNMVGSIPSSIGVFSNLTVLSMAVNYLSGTIPSALGNLSSLTRLILDQNKFKGSIPATLGNLTKLELLEIKNNTLSGTLPQTLGSLANLLLFDVYLNQLTGTVPSFLSKLLKMQYLDIYSNKFHGPIPEFLNELRNLTYLYLGENSLTGTIPSNIGTLTQLISFYANTNKLVGTVPSSLSQLPNLEFLFIYENELTGNLDELFDSSVQHVLKNVVLYENRFTGNLPEQLFMIPTLEVVDCSNNCLDGALPQSICSSKSLKTLALDGMCAASSCRDYLFAGSNTYILRHTIADGIPPCLFELPRLETLHVSGNGVSGSLPDNVTLSDTFTDLALSHNFITGELPLSLQERQWSSIDLNNNRLSGTLSPNFVKQSSGSLLKLANNRLSGPLPSSIIGSTGSISILDGNLFECNYYKSDLPEQDSKRRTYQCGSNTFNLSYYVWLVASVTMIVTLSIYTVGKRDSLIAIFKLVYAVIFSQSHLLDEFEIAGIDKLPVKFHLRRYRRICDMLKLCRRLGTVVMAFIIMLLLPYYAIVSISAGTVQYQYAYKVSIIYLTGKVAAGLAMTFLFILLLYTFVNFAFLLRRYQKGTVKFEKDIGFVASEASIRESYSPNEKKNSCEKVLVYLALISADLIVVSFANIGFVYFVIYGNEATLPFVQAALSLFKIAWGDVCSRVIYHLSVHVDFQSKNIRRAVVSLYAGITVLNNIIVPCVVVMAISTTCFYNLVKQGHNIESSYDYQECVAFDEGGCYQYTSITNKSSFSPPFVYSYQCSASFITYYAPSFVYICIISGFIIPSIRYFTYCLVRIVPENGCLHAIMMRTIPLILRPIYPNKKPQPSLRRPFFDARTQLVMIFNYLAILLTFGAMFPPLAVATTALIISSIFCARMEVKRFLKEAVEKNLPEYVKIIDRNCMGFGSDRMLLRGAAALVMLASCFYTLFIFDTLGDEVKFHGAYWVLIVMPLFPISLVILFMVHTGPKFVRAKMSLASSVNSASNVVIMLQEMLKREGEGAINLEEASVTISPITHEYEIEIQDQIADDTEI